MFAGGYSRSVNVYDLNRGDRSETFENIHTEHINVVKFSNHSPHLFATCSFDKSVKLWDLRLGHKPIFTRWSAHGNVTVCFSDDDQNLLVSAIDNEVSQFRVPDGHLSLKLRMNSVSPLNFTRSYYMDKSNYIVTGCCEEGVVRVFCSRTGKFLCDTSVPFSPAEQPYVQSLRGDPLKPFCFSAIFSSVVAHTSLYEFDLTRSGDPSIPQTHLSGE
eukprot:c19672_g1_i3.p1 GENE.c19672_g1_i3~~c19672_g1_i3.p1  ORF type:complete len:216 (+),score=40.66 c19672_g1_i3:315-962(+)